MATQKLFDKKRVSLVGFFQSLSFCHQIQMQKKYLALTIECFIILSVDWSVKEHLKQGIDRLPLAPKLAFGKLNLKECNKSVRYFPLVCSDGF